MLDFHLMATFTSIGSAASLRTHFRKDPPWSSASHAAQVDLLEGRIAGCSAVPFGRNADERGYLTELLTTREGNIDPIVHVYQVFAESGSVRAWIYHANQSDRLCFTDGQFRIALLDLRDDSPTSGNLATLNVGTDSPVLLTIAPVVAHGVMNICPRRASYINLPNRVYDLQDPDKYRIPADSPLIDFEW